MVRRLFLLLACAGFAFAQEDESGITEDEAPPAGFVDEPPKPAKSGEPERATAHPAREPGKKVATVVVKKKVYSLTLPTDWVLHPFDDTTSELAWDLLLPGSTKRASLYLLREEGRDPRSLPYTRASWFRKDKPDAKVEVLLKPAPRLVVRQGEAGQESVDVYASTSVKNNTYTLRLRCAPGDYAQAEADLLAAARTFAAEVELWPPIPKRYEITEQGVWLVARSPRVTASIAPLVKALKDVERRFRRDHGPLPKSDAPIVVLVEPTRASIQSIEPKAAEGQNDNFAVWGDRRMLAVPIAKDSKVQEGKLAYVAHGILFSARYGDYGPDWIRAGECMAAKAEVFSDKPLPILDEGYVSWLSTLRLHTLDEMEKLREADSETWVRESFFYVAALREGKYRKQYRAFLDDFSETSDALGAYARHIGTIDQADFLDSTNKFLSTRIKEEKREHEKH